MCHGVAVVSHVTVSIVSASESAVSAAPHVSFSFLRACNSQTGYVSDGQLELGEEELGRDMLECGANASGPGGPIPLRARRNRVPDEEQRPSRCGSCRPVCNTARHNERRPLSFTPQDALREASGSRCAAPKAPSPLARWPTCTSRIRRRPCAGAPPPLSLSISVAIQGAAVSACSHNRSGSLGVT